MSTATTDAINARILAVGEDQLAGFQVDPVGEIARRTGLEREVVRLRMAEMLRAGTIRRVRQTLLATNLAPGALVAWEVPEEKLGSAFEWMFKRDPFSGHVVIRSTDAATAGAKYRLWTTVKVPQGFSMERHCELLCARTGALRYKLLPAKMLFVLGVGHVRRRGIEVGSKADVPADAIEPRVVELSGLQWRVLVALKREFTAAEIEAEGENLWEGRAKEARVSLEEFVEVARGLDKLRVIGRFSTFLEHVKPLASGEQVTRYNALFHWAVAAGRAVEAGRQIGRFHIMTHAYWREAGVEFNGVNLMGVAHGTDKQLLMAHKRAMDEHLQREGIEVSYTNVFWGGRSEIKPSEIVPGEYEAFWKSEGSGFGGQGSGR